MAIALVAVVVMGSGITGNAVTNAPSAKTDNTPCARECTSVCTPNAAMPAPGAEMLSVHDCVLQCMNARCGQTARAGKCDAFSADGCCNVFSEGTDPDCAPTCTPAGTCAVNEDGSDCCSGYASSDGCPTAQVCV